MPLKDRSAQQARGAAGDPVQGALDDEVLVGSGVVQIVQPQRPQPVDDDHLTRWGQSQILAPFRRQLKGVLGAPELEGRNLSYLVAARQQHDGHRDDIRDLRAALRHAAGAGAHAASLYVEQQLANALFEAGFLIEAAESQRRAVAEFARLRLRRDEAPARLELALCLAKAGAFDEAQQELRQAWLLVTPLPPETTRDLRRLLLQNAGWLASQLGRDEEAATRHRSGMPFRDRKSVV